MKIAEFARKSGISVDTLRYYDKIGLLVPLKKEGQRVYIEEDLKKAYAIIRLKKLNFSLNEIKFVLDIDNKIDKSLKEGEFDKKAVEKILEILKEKYQKIIQYEKEIQEVKKDLDFLIKKVTGVIK